MREPLHLVHVVHSFGWGGLERVVADLTHRLGDEFRHTLVCLTAAGPGSAFLAPSVPVLELHRPRRTTAAFLWRLRGTLRALKPGLLCTYNWSGVDGILAGRWAGVHRILQHEHGWAVEDLTGRHPRRLRVRRWLSRWVRAFVCVSRDMVAWLKEEVRVRAPVVQITNGVDLSRFHPEPQAGRAWRCKEGIAPETYLIGIVARLDPIKNHAGLFRAFGQVRRELPGAELLVVGDGPEAQAVRGAAPAGVRFLGARADVPELLRALDVFVLPSFREGISITILEAMASGLPVVATRVGGNPELVVPGETGELVPPGDAEALAQALLRYGQEPERRRAHGEAARRRAEAHFSLERMVGAYRDLYRREAER